MMRNLRSKVREFLDGTELFALRYLWGNGRVSFLREAGWFESFRRKESVDARGQPVPWLTYAALAFLEPRVKPEMAVFEWGCGNSTLWWARRVRRVVACEHDPAWHAKVARTCPQNVELRHIDLTPDGPYAGAASAHPAAFDVVVIDGRDRVHCAKRCVPALTKDGVILWDNSDRQEYEEGYAFLAEEGFRRLDFGGMGPINVDGWCTSVFYRRDNCFGI